MNFNINFNKYIKKFGQKRNYIVLIILFILGIFRSVSEEIFVTRILENDKIKTFNFKSFQISYQLSLTLLLSLLTTLISKVDFVKDNVTSIVKKII